MARRTLARTSVRDALASDLIAIDAAGVETPRLDAELLLADAMGVDRAVIVADPSRPIEPAAARRFQDHARRRVQREPVAYILGTKGFRALDLHVDARVLIPRPETEHLVEAALGLPHGARVCDVGTGSGAVALALKHERPDLELLATDSSEPALEVARGNAAALGLDVTFILADLLEGVPGPLDAVVSNPPYVAHGEAIAVESVRFEPPAAFDGGPDGLDAYRRLAPQARERGARTIAVEIGHTQAAAVARILADAGFPATHVVADLAGLDRVVVGTC